MSKFQKEDTPCPYMSEIKDEQQKGLVIPPKKYKIGIAKPDVEANKQTLPQVESHQFIMKDGEIYRIGKNGKQYPPINKEDYEKIAKMRAARKDKEQEDFEH